MDTDLIINYYDILCILMYHNKYIKYKNKYISLKNQNGGSIKFVILHNPNPMLSKEDNSKQYNNIINEISKLGEVYNYYFRFGTNDIDFIIDDMQFEIASQDLYEKFKDKGKLYIICLEEASSYGLYFANVYPQICNAIVCYPLRLNTKESLERHLWKYKEKEGWKKYVSQKYDIDNYLININNTRLKQIQQNKSNEEEKTILYLIMNYNIRKQYEKIPKIFKIPTHLFTRLDLNISGVLERNFERKSIADMKEIVSTNDAILTSMMWNIARVQYDENLLKENETNNNLRIQYLVGDFEKQNDLNLIDKIKIIIN